MSRARARYESSHQHALLTATAMPSALWARTRARWRRCLVAMAPLALLLLTSGTSAAQQLWFETPKKDDCKGDGNREWSAIITGTNYTGDWVVACQQTTAEIEGAQRKSRDCAKMADLRVWGKFDVPDPSCPTKNYTVGCGGGGCMVGSKGDVPLGSLGFALALVLAVRWRRRFRAG